MGGGRRQLQVEMTMTAAAAVIWELLQNLQSSSNPDGGGSEGTKASS